jgi:hypothetical protein
MEKVKKIQEFVKENDNGWIADWNDTFQVKANIFFSHFYNVWKYDCTQSMEFIGTTHMSEDCAKSLVYKLNSGEIIL